ncbi:MAG: peptidoglycan-binding protein [Cocleimonas sp.]|nr:peptidoglycan-binding protein [Cocleimonas sp.]
MNKSHQLSLTSLVLAGLFATGCSQQQIHEPIEPTPEPAPVVIQPEPVRVPAPVVVQPAPVPVVVRPAPVIRPKPAPRRKVNPNCHHHAANSMTRSIQHCHKNPQGKHRYGGNTIRRATPVVRRAPIVRKAPAKPRVDVRALQRKLKSKGYYRGPIDGVVGNGTRDALKRFQNR